MSISRWNSDNILELNANVPWVKALGCTLPPTNMVLVLSCVPSNAGVHKAGIVITFAAVSVTIELKSNGMHHEALSEPFPSDIVNFSVMDVFVKDVHCACIAGDSKNHPPVETADFTVWMIILSYSGHMLGMPLS